MKLIGTVSSIKQTKVTNYGRPEELKTSYVVNFRPTQAMQVSHCYGSMSINIHGSETGALGLSLDAGVELIIQPINADYAGRTFDDLQEEVFILRDKSVAADAKARMAEQQKQLYQKASGEHQLRAQALQLENVRLLTELTTLKQMLGRSDELPRQIDMDQRS